MERMREISPLSCSTSITFTHRVAGRPRGVVNRAGIQNQPPHRRLIHDREDYFQTISAQRGSGRT